MRPSFWDAADLKLEEVHVRSARILMPENDLRALVAKVIRERLDLPKDTPGLTMKIDFVTSGASRGITAQIDIKQDLLPQPEVGACVEVDPASLRRTLR